MVMMMSIHLKVTTMMTIIFFDTYDDVPMSNPYIVDGADVDDKSEDDDDEGNNGDDVQVRSKEKM